MAGRPLSEFDLPEGWEETILELYSNGGSDAEVKAEIYGMRGSFSNDLWDRWMRDEPIFSEAIKKGKMLSEAWWVKQGRVNLKDRDFSATLFYMNMKNRFKWSDKQEVDHSSSDGSMTPPTQIVFTKS